VGTVGGALLGTSTVTSYIESTAGVEEGSRTGLASVVTGFLFLLAIFFSPLVRMIGGGYAYSLEDQIFLYPVTAPVLIVVAALMLKEVIKIEWDDFSESIPAFLTVIGMPLTGSIADGLAFGFISYTIIKLVTGKFKDLNIILVIITIIFLVRFILIKM
jgi:AGZA family xanthine/uracil permease-like MFS transporter